MLQLAFAAIEPVLEPEIVRDSVEGRDCFTRFFLQVLLTPPSQARRPDHGAALADAMEQVPEANVLADAVMSVDEDEYLLVQRTCAVVTGRPGRVR